MRFRDFFRLADDWMTLVDGSDATEAAQARARIIAQVQQLVTMAVAWLQANDAAAIGNMLDAAVQRARRSPFFAP